MASTNQRYPHSTPDGKSIPLEVIKSHGVMKVAFAGAVSAAMSIPANIEVISFHADQNCIIRFGGNAEALVNGVLLTNAFYLPRGLRVTLAPTANTFTVISDGTNGTLIANMLEKWAGLTVATNITRI